MTLRSCKRLPPPAYVVPSPSSRPQAVALRSCKRLPPAAYVVPSPSSRPQAVALRPCERLPPPAYVVYRRLRDLVLSLGTRMARIRLDIFYRCFIFSILTLTELTRNFCVFSTSNFLVFFSFPFVLVVFDKRQFDVFSNFTHFTLLVCLK